MSKLRALAFVALLPALACASELQSDLPTDDTSAAGGLRGLGSATNSAGHAGNLSYSGTTSAHVTTGGSAASNSGGAPSHAGRSAGGGNAGASGAAGTAGSAAAAGSAGALGTGGSLNQPTQCDEASATALGTMNSNVTVASNVCLKMTLPADQTWIKKLTLQPDSGQYPLPFTWSNCGTNSSGAFTANYANVVLNPVTAQCPVLVKLGGNGAPINVQWWGG